MLVGWNSCSYSQYSSNLAWKHLLRTQGVLVLFIPEKHPLSRQVQLAFLMSQVVRNLHTLQTFEYLSCSVTLWFMLLGKLYILHFIVWRTAQTKSRTTYATQKRSILPLTWSLKTLTFSLAEKRSISGGMRWARSVAFSNFKRIWYQLAELTQDKTARQACARTCDCTRVTVLS